MKKKTRTAAVQIPPPAWSHAKMARMVRKDGSPRLSGSIARDRNGYPIRGAFGKHSSAIKRRQETVADSQRAGIKLANDRQLRQAYRKFYSTPEGRAFARRFGKSTTGAVRKSNTSTNDIDFKDPADLPDSVGCGSRNGKMIVNHGPHPVDEIEPQKISVEVEGFSDEEISAASETFGRALRWGLDSSDIVIRGRRAIVIIACMRPDLAAGFNVDAVLRSDFLIEEGSGTRFLDSLEACGLFFARYLEFMRRGVNLAMIGERIDFTAYALHPDLLPAATLAKLGEILNKTRQAKDKLVGDFRDTFSGLKPMQARPEITRDRCRASQLAAPTT
jgi:hypothetical protein